MLYVDVTFIISSSEGSPEGAPSTRLPIWDLLQIYQGIGQRLSVHIENLTAVFVLNRSGQHQSQLKQEYMQPLTEKTDTHKVRKNAFTRIFITIFKLTLRKSK